MKRVYIVQDDSSHWYIIPYELKEDFSKLAYDEELEEEFDKLFSAYRTGGSLNNDRIKLYSDI